MRYIFIHHLLLFPVWAIAQAPYTVKVYPYRIESNLVYGVATNYYGGRDTLKLDLYKPIGDGNAQRPLLVLVHGGGWTVGCKDDQLGGVVTLAKEMVQRGYVVASINYRLGWHRTPQDVGLLNPYKCNYPADSCEIIRAIYRAQQDTKAAIRWLKARNLQDSTCRNAVLVGGDSAGGFNALAVGFLDRDVEKPACAYALNPAPTAWAGLAQCATYQCQTLTVAPSGTALQRPDLGGIRGDLNLTSGVDDEVAGVLSFYGAVPHIALINNWISGPDTPAVYLYHQTCDAIVPFGSIPISYMLSNWCNLGNTPWHYNLPLVHGSGAIAAYFQSMPKPPQFATDFISCPDFNPDLALLECLRMQDNGSYHYIINPAERAKRAAEFFSPLISEKIQACKSTSVDQQDLGAVPKFWPNPVSQELSIEMDFSDPVRLEIWSVTGQLHIAITLNQMSRHNIDVSELPNGLYFAKLHHQTFKFLKIRE